MTKATRSIYIMISSHTVVHPGEFFMETALMHRIDWSPRAWLLQSG